MPDLATRRRTSSPIVAWGVLGAASVVLMAVVLTRWAADGIETGSTSIQARQRWSR